MSYRCGQCGAGSLYRNDDPVNRVAYIACIICGNRWPGGMAPVKTGESGKEPEGAGESGKEPKGAEDMNKRGNCLNCDRERNLIAGLCHTCWQSAKGMTGEAREKALAATRARIEAGSARFEAARNNEGQQKEKPEPHPGRGENMTKPKTEWSAAKQESKYRQQIVDYMEEPKSFVGHKNDANGDLPSVTIIFRSERDQALFARLAEEAAVQRRDMDQQILYSLEARQ